MATQCRKRANRNRLVALQAWLIIGALVLVGFLGGFAAGRITAPKKVSVTETVKVVSYEQGRDLNDAD